MARESKRVAHPCSSYMYVVKAAETTFVQKICTFNVDEIDNRVGSNIYRVC